MDLAVRGVGVGEKSIKEWEVFVANFLTSSMREAVLSIIRDRTSGYCRRENKVAKIARGHKGVAEPVNIKGNTDTTRDTKTAVRDMTNTSMAEMCP